jgi:hypothetical protein
MNQVAIAGFLKNIHKMKIKILTGDFISQYSWVNSRKIEGKLFENFG